MPHLGEDRRPPTEVSRPDAAGLREAAEKPQCEEESGGRLESGTEGGSKSRGIDRSSEQLSARDHREREWERDENQHPERGNRDADAFRASSSDAFRELGHRLLETRTQEKQSD